MQLSCEEVLLEIYRSLHDLHLERHILLFILVTKSVILCFVLHALVYS